jgi:hypothetical protein
MQALRVAFIALIADMPLDWFVNPLVWPSIKKPRTMPGL